MFLLAGLVVAGLLIGVSQVTAAAPSKITFTPVKEVRWRAPGDEPNDPLHSVEVSCGEVVAVLNPNLNQWVRFSLGKEIHQISKTDPIFQLDSEGC